MGFGGSQRDRVRDEAEGCEPFRVSGRYHFVDSLALQSSAMTGAAKKPLETAFPRGRAVCACLPAARAVAVQISARRGSELAQTKAPPRTGTPTQLERHPPLSRYPLVQGAGRRRASATSAGIEAQDDSRLAGPRFSSGLSRLSRLRGRRSPCERDARDPASIPGTTGQAARLQNIVLSLADCSGMTCRTSQSSTILPSSSNRKMSMPA